MENKNMKLSVCVTIYNEINNIRKFIDSLMKGAVVPDELLIVDAGSDDGTVEYLTNLRLRPLKCIFYDKKISRSMARNIAVSKAKYDMIAMTDAGCNVDKYWLQRMIGALEHDNENIIAGFYKMVGKSPFQKASSIYLGVLPSHFDESFLPSTRSMAFTKTTFKRVGGFPEKIQDTAEDTIFNNEAIKRGIKFTRVKNAIVYWEMPKNISVFFSKLFRYSKGDVKSKIWIHKQNHYTSHNFRVIKVFIRYFIALALLFFALVNPIFTLILFSLLFVYILWSFNKSYSVYKDFRVGLWGVILQFVSDFAVMSGFIFGFL